MSVGTPALSVPIWISACLRSAVLLPWVSVELEQFRHLKTARGPVCSWGLAMLHCYWCPTGCGNFWASAGWVCTSQMEKIAQNATDAMSNASSFVCVGWFGCAGLLGLVSLNIYMYERDCIKLHPSVAVVTAQILCTCVTIWCALVTKWQKSKCCLCYVDLSITFRLLSNSWNAVWPKCA